METDQQEKKLLTLDDIHDDTQEKSKKYHASRIQLDIFGKFYAPIALIVFWLIGIPNLLAVITGTSFSVSGAFLMATSIILILEIVELPLAIASQILERRYGFSTQTWKRWTWDQVKSLILQIVLLGIPLTLLYWAIDSNPEHWWIYGFVGAFIFVAFVQAIAPIVLIPLFMKLEPFPEGELKQRIASLADRMGIKYKDIYMIHLSQQTTKANAMVTGFGKTIRISLGDTLVHNFRPDEIEVVMAHEIAHQKHKDVYRFVLLTGVLFFLVFFLAEMGFQWVIETFDYSGKSDPRTMFYLISLMNVVLLIVQPILNFYSRSRERAADIAAIKELKNFEVYESAFIRLALQNLANLNPSKLDVIFNYTHPPIKDRIEYARDVATRLNLL